MDTIAASGGWRSTLDCFRCATISEAIMKAILSMALVLGVCGLAGAADDKVVDPVGTWKCEYEIGGQQRTSTLKIKKDGDNLAGTMSWPDQDETKLKDLKLKDGTLTFSAERKLAGMDDGITVEYKLTVDGDKLKGKGAAEFGGEKREWDIEGKRPKNDSSRRAVLRVPTADGRGGPRYRPFFAPEMRGARCAVRSIRPKRFSPIDADLFQSPFCSGNALCPCARVLC